MLHPGQLITGDVSAWFDMHPNGTDHETVFFANGVGQIILYCMECMVMAGHNDIEAGNPIPQKAGS